MTFNCLNASTQAAVTQTIPKHFSTRMNDKNFTALVIRIGLYINKNYQITICYENDEKDKIRNDF